MFVRRRHPRFAFWAVAFALLLKAAVPLLASAAAQQQGKTLVEVCTVYGIKTVALEADGSTTDLPADTDPHGAAAVHGSDHCVLSGMLAHAAPAQAPAAAIRVPPHWLPPATAPPSTTVPDAAAAWSARLYHPPPSLA
ncbi:DUF2946 family protein [Eleftheria terrae]|uniref:DUF2946 family protein n=1 Tax=Eleftheria terrae TaxID=1597781 RepID=UPI00263BDE1F|nr:DUF2946 family protein [Eleftheria terrae]WKB52884.1 hypothetical protein N7L95_24455 [Eleftheria terrae]